MYEKFPKICISAFCISILLYIFTPEKGMKVYVPEVSAKEVQTATGKTASGVSLEIPNGGKEDSKKEGKGNNKPTYKEYAMSSGSNAISTCNAECKISELSKKGIRDEIAKSLVINCKALTDDPRHCIIVGASISTSESGGGKRCKNFNCFGVGGGRIAYKSYDEGVKDWVIRYSKYWYKAKSASYFYPSKGNKSPSRYCTSEVSSGSDVGCPYGQKNAQNMWNKLEKVF